MSRPAWPVSGAREQVGAARRGNSRGGSGEGEAREGKTGPKAARCAPPFSPCAGDGKWCARAGYQKRCWVRAPGARRARGPPQCPVWRAAREQKTARGSFARAPREKKRLPLRSCSRARDVRCCAEETESGRVDCRDFSGAGGCCACVGVCCVCATPRASERDEADGGGVRVRRGARAYAGGDTSFFFPGLLRRHRVRGSPGACVSRPVPASAE